MKYLIIALLGLLAFQSAQAEDLGKPRTKFQVGPITILVDPAVAQDWNFYKFDINWSSSELKGIVVRKAVNNRRLIGAWYDKNGIKIDEESVYTNDFQVGEPTWLTFILGASVVKWRTVKIQYKD